MITQNPADNVSPPPVETTEVQVLQDVSALLARLEGRQGRFLYTIAAVALGTGMRRGELLALRV